MGRALVNSPVEAKAAGVPTVYFVIKKLGGTVNGYYCNENNPKWGYIGNATRFSTPDEAANIIDGLAGKDRFYQIETIYQTFTK